MIEIKLGQGALMGMGKKIPPQDLPGRARELMGLKENEDAVIGELFFENQTLQDMKDLVERTTKTIRWCPYWCENWHGW